jgi:hypothetical protein
MRKRDAESIRQNLVNLDLLSVEPIALLALVEYECWRSSFDAGAAQLVTYDGRIESITTLRPETREMQPYQRKLKRPRRRKEFF